MPLRQSLRIGAYLMGQKLARKDKFPLIVELEPLFACNLACAGCGKIQEPASVLKQRMPVDQAIAAIEECGAPMVSIAGGEPLMHPQIDVLVSELIKRKKYVFLCTNALLIPRKIDKFKPSRYFAWAVHIDGLAERHDASVCKDGVFDEAVAAARQVTDESRAVDLEVLGRHAPRGALDHLVRDLGLELGRDFLPGRSIEAGQELAILLPSVPGQALHGGVPLVVALEDRDSRT